MKPANHKLLELQGLEERLWIAEFRLNKVWMEKILAEDFFEFGRSGRKYYKEDCLNISVATFDAVIPLPDFKARFIGRDTIQTTYKSIVTYDSTIEYANRSSIWLKTSDGYKLKFHQGTPTEK